MWRSLCDAFAAGGAAADAAACRRGGAAAMIRRGPVAGLALALAACSRREIAPDPQASVVLVSIDTCGPITGTPGYARGRTARSTGWAARASCSTTCTATCPHAGGARIAPDPGSSRPHHEVRDNMGFRLGESHRTAGRAVQVLRASRPAALSPAVRAARADRHRRAGSTLWDDALTIDAANLSLGDLQRDAVGRGREPAALRRDPGRPPLLRVPAPLRAAPRPGQPPAAYRDLPEPVRRRRVAYAGRAGRALPGWPQGTGPHRPRGARGHVRPRRRAWETTASRSIGIFLYREALHVPLVVRLPGGTAAGRRGRGPHRAGRHPGHAAGPRRRRRADGIGRPIAARGDAQRSRGPAHCLFGDALPALPLRMELTSTPRPKPATATSARAAPGAASTSTGRPEARRPTSRASGRRRPAAGHRRGSAADDGRRDRARGGRRRARGRSWRRSAASARRLGRADRHDDAARPQGQRSARTRT